jgi:hypothetical protein
MAKPSSPFFENLSTLHQFITPYRILSYAMWILVIIENENVCSGSGLQWHNFHNKRNENRTIALSVLTAA